MAPDWLDDTERAVGVRLVAVVELLPGVLDAQLRQTAGLTHVAYSVLTMLSVAVERTLRMTTLAQRRNATLPRFRGFGTAPPAGSAKGIDFVTQYPSESKRTVKFLP
jgi:hypothetical protein